MASNMHQNEWFQVRFFKHFLGRGSPSPLPRPLPFFFSGFALDLGFALNSRALCALDSGFALDTRALRALELDSGFALNFRLGTLVWPSPKINSWIRPWRRAAMICTGRVDIREDARNSNWYIFMKFMLTLGRLRGRGWIPPPGVFLL